MTPPTSIPTPQSPGDLLADLTSGDATRIWSASSGVTHLRDAAGLDLLAAHLPEIRQRTANVELGGALIRNATHLAFALKKLAYWQGRAGCLCRLYPEYLLFDPRREARDNNVRVDETVHDRQWVDYYLCTCTVCGARYRVEERESHYTWWGWQALEPSP